MYPSDILSVSLKYYLIESKEYAVTALWQGDLTHHNISMPDIFQHFYTYSSHVEEQPWSSKRADQASKKTNQVRKMKIYEK